MASGPRISFGAATLVNTPTDVLTELSDTLERHGRKEIDTARVYVRVLLSLFYCLVVYPLKIYSERRSSKNSKHIIGEHGAAARFTISTKARSFEDEEGTPWRAEGA